MKQFVRILLTAFLALAGIAGSLAQTAPNQDSGMVPNGVTVPSGTQVRSASFQDGAAAGDSEIAGVSNGASLYAKSLGRSGLQFRDHGNFAVAGTTTAQIAAQIPSVCASGAKFAAIDGGINDIVGAISEQTIENNLIANWNALRSCGVQPFDIGLFPTNTSGNVAAYMANETWRKLWTWKNRITHVDVYSALGTSTGAYQAGVNQDPIHYNTVGSAISADLFTSYITQPAKIAPPLLAATDTGSQMGSFINNAVSFGGAGSTSLPANWFAIGAGCTFVVTAAAPTDLGTGGLGNWMRCTLSGAATNVGFNTQAVSLASLGWSIGDTIASGFCIRWVDSSQSLTVTVTNTAWAGYAPVFQQKGGTNGDNQCFYAEGVIPAGAVNVLLAFEATGTGYFEVARPTMVNLNKVGQYNSVLGLN